MTKTQKNAIAAKYVIKGTSRTHRLYAARWKKYLDKTLPGFKGSKTALEIRLSREYQRRMTLLGKELDKNKATKAHPTKAESTKAEPKATKPQTIESPDCVLLDMPAIMDFTPAPAAPAPVKENNTDDLKALVQQIEDVLAKVNALLRARETKAAPVKAEPKAAEPAKEKPAKEKPAKEKAAKAKTAKEPERTKPEPKAAEPAKAKAKPTKAQTTETPKKAQARKETASSYVRQTPLTPSDHISFQELMQKGLSTWGMNLTANPTANLTAGVF